MKKPPIPKTIADGMFRTTSTGSGWIWFFVIVAIVLVVFLNTRKDERKETS